MTTLNRTTAKPVSPAAALQETLKQKDAQIERLKQSLADEMEGRQRAIQEASQARAENVRLREVLRQVKDILRHHHEYNYIQKQLYAHKCELCEDARIFYAIDDALEPIAPTVKVNAWVEQGGGSL